MKLINFLCLSCIPASFVFSQPESSQPSLLMPSNPAESTPSGFIYFRFSGAEYSLLSPDVPLAGCGLGYRRIMGSVAVDVSMNGNWFGDNKQSSYFWTAPRISCFHLFQPNQDKSWYLGGGLAWGKLQSKTKSPVKDPPYKYNYYDPSYEYDDEYNCYDPWITNSKFSGIIPSVTAGYQFAKQKSALGFFEISVSQPALPLQKEGAFPGPIVEASIGVGF